MCVCGERWRREKRHTNRHASTQRIDKNIGIDESTTTCMCMCNLWLCRGGHITFLFQHCALSFVCEYFLLFLSLSVSCLPLFEISSFPSSSSPGEQYYYRHHHHHCCEQVILFPTVSLSSLLIQEFKSPILAMNA